MSLYKCANPLCEKLVDYDVTESRFCSDECKEAYFGTNAILKARLREVLRRPGILEKIEKRRKFKADYNPALWGRAKEKLNCTDFPDANMTKLIADKKVAAQSFDEAHWDGKERHSLLTYAFSKEIGFFIIEWRYSFCTTCNKVIYKRGILLNPYENLAYIRHYIRDGNPVARVIKKDYKKPLFDEAAELDRLTDQLIAYDLEEYTGVKEKGGDLDA